jgi:hypothetical protein
MVGFSILLVNDAGPVQWCEVPGIEVRCNAEPTQSGELLPIDTTKSGFMMTDVVAVAVQLLAPVTVTVYMPFSASVTFEIVGFCIAELNPFGPIHAYETPPDAFSCSVLFTQSGPLLDADTIGSAFTIMLAVVDAVQLFTSVTVTV